MMVGGMINEISVGVALVPVLREPRWAPGFAFIVGFRSAALFTYPHVLPTFLPGYQDSFTSGPRVNVTWFSWLTAAAEIGAGLVLGYIGLRARRRVTNRPAGQGNSECCTSKSTSA